MAITRSWAKNPQNFEIISRDEAHRLGRRIYFDGPEKPCKRGHVAPRYVANAGCLACLTRHADMRAKNAFSHDLVLYVPRAPFWRSKRLTLERLAQLDKYVQQCVDTYCNHFVGPVCKACDGTRYVPVAGSAPPRWEACEACAEPIPSTAADVPTGTEERAP